MIFLLTVCSPKFEKSIIKIVITAIDKNPPVAVLNSVYYLYLRNCDEGNRSKIFIVYFKHERTLFIYKCQIIYGKEKILDFIISLFVY